MEAAPYLHRRDNSVREEAYLLGILSSRILDWWARRHVESHVNFDKVGAFRIPSVSESHPGFQTVVSVATQLAVVSDQLAEWGNQVGVQVAPLSDVERENQIALLDASVARLYGLSSTQVVHLYETFHTGWKAEEREPYTEAVLGHLASFDWDPAPVEGEI